jgi:Nucleotidyl transferase AbiEii toxin, Type IV TA system
LPPEAFLGLDRQTQREIYLSVSQKTGLTGPILEKDVWVCWTLNTLFSMPNALPMAFKGGTSLSKVYSAISKFSEDIDVTIAYKALDDSIDPFDTSTSRKARDRYSAKLKNEVARHVSDVVAPHFRSTLAEELAHDFELIELDDANPENLLIHYPSAFDETGDYLASRVKVEFGGRNAILPNETHLVQAYAAEHTTGLSFPQAAVQVLAAERTFWEKATLIHVACGRPLREDSSRQSRHWYDLDRLAQSDIGRRALANRDLLTDVVKVKKVFFNSSAANYDACLSGRLLLIPTGDSLTELKRDYSAMQAANMLLGAVPDFEDIINRLGQLADSINKAI